MSTCHDDGTVEWHAVGGEQQKGASKDGGKKRKIPNTPD
jgi:hypothetical protein